MTATPLNPLTETPRHAAGETKAESQMELNAEVNNAYLHVITRLTSAADQRDHQTANHVKRVSAFSEILAKTAGLTDEFCSNRANSVLKNLKP